MNKKVICVFAGLLSMIAQSAAQEFPSPTPASIRLEAFEQRQKLKETSLFSQLEMTGIGPSVFSGRVVDVEVNPANPSEMYVAYASGGLWYTANNGTTFTPVFDQEAVMTIGDIAVNWNAGIIWVGTGENNSSRSSYSGVGLYKSGDKGKTWKHVGLEESHHIGRIVIHPVNPNIVHVACLGALYSENPNRGIYSTPDGGVTWRKSLFINPNAGAIDLVMDPTNPNTLYAATWERTRRAWDFTEGGEGTGLHKSTDGGRTWKLLSTAGSGFPSGPGAGRIGLDIVKTRQGIVLYALIDNQAPRPPKDPDSDVLTKVQLADMSATTFLDLDKEKISAYLQSNGFPARFTADTILTLVRNGTIRPATLVEYVQNANSQLFETEVTGAEVYKSTDGGQTWKRTHEDYLDQVYHTYGYYFGQIRVASTNPQKVYILGVPLLKSDDGGVTWRSIGADNVHVDHHALWVNPRKEGHLVLGNDGGLNISYDDGVNWIKCNQPAVGQFYSVQVDMAKPYNVYGGLQDNGVWVGPATYKPGVAWHNSGQYPYKEIMGGDGMQIAVDTRDNNTVYTGYQFGNYFSLSRQGDRPAERITPVHELGQRPYRWNWETPIHLSRHNQDILYMGAERVFRSMEKGKNFKAISGDLTRGSRAGDVPYGTLVSLHESPLVFGLLYVGSDDGYIHITRDGGHNWQRISDELPQQLWVSTVQASAYAEGRVYASLNGYRWDHFDSYVYVSEDYGASWKRIATDLPAEPVNVIKEDPSNANILYFGTDHGLYISLDRGQHSMLMGDMPAAPVHDLIVHPRDKELIVATHGRSFFKTNVAHVQQIHSDLTAPLTCFNEKLTIRHRENWGNTSASWREIQEPNLTLPVFTKRGGEASLMIFADSLLVGQQPLMLHRGLKYYTLQPELLPAAVESLKFQLADRDPNNKVTLKQADNGKYYLPPGTYTLQVHLGQDKAFASLEIKGKD